MKKTMLLLAFTAVICVAMSKFAPKPGSPAKVEIITAHTTTVTKKVSASGAIEPYRTRRLGVSGYAVADEVYLNVGDAVREGQVIATFHGLDAPTVDLSLDALLEAVDAGELLNGDIAAAVVGTVADSVSTSELVSPFDGVVTALDIVEGEQASPFAAVAEVSDLSRMRARVRVPEADLPSVKVGMPANVYSGGVRYDAVVIEASPSVRTSVGLTGDTSRYGEVLLELYNADGAYPGSSADAVISVERRSGVILLPYEAVDQDEHNREFVYVLSDSTVRRRYVTIGDEYDGRIEVLGLSAGERVILSSDADLYDGMAAEVSR